MTYFFDASFLIALFNKDDTFHQQAIETIKATDEKNPGYLTSNIALAETINISFRKKGAMAVKKFLSQFPKSNIQLIYLNKEISELGCNILLSQKSKRGLNFFDCLHLATMKHLGIENLLTFDKDFNGIVRVNKTD